VSGWQPGDSHKHEDYEPVTDMPAIEAVAALLLWAGWDRAADAIYAAIELQEDASGSNGRQNV
jgi:hypothetical protein